MAESTSKHAITRRGFAKGALATTAAAALAGAFGGKPVKAFARGE